MLNKKFFLVLLLSLVMLTVLGCGEDEPAAPAAPTDDAAEEDAQPDEAPAPEPSGEAVTLRLGHVVQEQAAIHQAALAMAEWVEAESGGSMKIEVYPASQLGDNRELVESIQMGTIDLSVPHIGILAGFTREKTAVFEMPYIFKNEEAAEFILDGEIGDMLKEEALTDGIMILAYWTQGWRHITTGGTPVETPEDMQGLRFRTMEVPLHIEHFNTLGASAIPMAFSEVYTSLQQGVIDGQENPYVNIYLMGFYEVQPYLIETGHVYDPTPLIMSEISYNNLSPEHQELIKEAGIKFREYNRELSRSNADEYKEAILATGNNTIIELTPEQRQRFREAAQPVYDNFEDQDLLRRVEELQEGF